MISNSTPLILLSKIDKLEILKKLFNQITIPESVKEEVLIESKPGYIVIKKGIDDKWIKVEKPNKILDLNLGKGETEAISLANEKKDILIIDDLYAIRAAKVYNIETIRTTTLLFMALKKKIISKNESIDLLNKLIQEGYYIKPAEYATIFGKIKEL